MGLLTDLRDRGLWPGYSRYVLGLEPVLDAMSKRGVPVSPEAHAALVKELTELYNAAEGAMQALVPDECKPFTPKNGYKKLPKDFAVPVTASDNALAAGGGSSSVKVSAGNPPSLPGASKPPIPSAVNVGAELPTRPNSQRGVSEAGGMDAPGREGGFLAESPTFLLKKFDDGEERWVRVGKWKPSHSGLIKYMRHKKHPIPRDWKTGKETTVEADLERLARSTKDILYEAVLEYRQVGTVLNNHLANWVPHTDGRVHPVFYYDTGTGQLASRRPNVQNAPRHGEGGKGERATRFRSMVVARPGHTLLEFDYRSFHAQTLAFEAEDPDYLRLAKLDIHSYLTAHLVRHPDRNKLLGFDDASLAQALAEIKHNNQFVRDYKAKRAVLGYGFGMGWRKLYMLNRDSFDSQADAKKVMDMLNGLFPRACAWRDRIRHQAHEQGYLMSRFGCIRWFWEVFKWDGTGWKSGGDDSEAAVAFLPANDAFCHIKEAMLRLNGNGVTTVTGVVGTKGAPCSRTSAISATALERYGLINQIHDALMFECPDPLVDEALVTVKEEMERPSVALVNDVAPLGLSVEVSVSRGKTWDRMEKI